MPNCGFMGLALDCMFDLQHFEAMDHSAQQLSELDASLGQATAFERYQQAAELKKKLDDLNGTDVVEEVMEVRAHLPLQVVIHSACHENPAPDYEPDHLVCWFRAPST